MTRQAKLDCRRRDDELRRQLAQELQADGFPAASAGQIAAWEPFDQNAGAADWFDAGYMFGVPNGFDVVIANPPYVRQEGIAPKSYKDALLKAYPDAAVGRSDLYCYFYARGLQLLKEGGMHLFVCSNSWLDVGYGAKLQEYLLDNATVDAIYESAVERQFATADINTLISVIRKRAGAGNGAGNGNGSGDDADADATRFVQLRAPLATALADAGQRREIVKTRAELRAAATSGRRFVGDKWGGKYLRAPDIYHQILDKYGDKLVRLGDIAAVRRGVTTGANDFFYLTPEVIAEFGIEPEYCRPVMTTPQESRRIAVAPAALAPASLYVPPGQGGFGRRRGAGRTLNGANSRAITGGAAWHPAAAGTTWGNEIRSRQLAMNYLVSIPRRGRSLSRTKRALSATLFQELNVATK